MASGNMDSSNSEDELWCVIRKRHCKRKNVVNSDSENDSDIEIRPRTMGAVRQIRDSESSTDEEGTGSGSLNTVLRKRQSSNCEVKDDDEIISATNDSSDNEQSEKCAICLNKFLGQDVATSEMCSHTFCAVCLQEWAKKVNTCPIDRQKFDMILLRHHGQSKAFKTISVKNKVLPTDDDDDDDDSDYASVMNCIVCGDNNEPNTIIMCNRCRLVYHRDCVNPPLLGYPLPNPWQCPVCRNMRLRGRILMGFNRVIESRFRSSPVRFGLPALLNPPAVIANTERRSQSRNNAQIFDDSSSTDSSDENTEFCSSINRRRHCQEIRNRRQSRIPGSGFTASASVPFAESPLEQTDGFLGNVDSNEEVYDYNWEEESVLSRVRRRTQQRIKTVLLPPRTVSATPARSSSNNYPTSSDIVGDILQLQTALRTPGGTLQRDGTVTLNTTHIGQQCPLNPAQGTPSKCSESTTSQQNSAFGSSSSSSSGSGSSQCRDLYSMPACSMLQSNLNADGYDTDSCSMVTHRSYGSSSVPEELKRDSREPTYSKDVAKTHSDEEVDIYSDIELTNEDETSLDTEMQAMSVSYKSDESHLAAAVGEGTDSSDNDLVIDEDIHGDEDGEKARSLLHSKSSDGTYNNSELVLEENDSSNSSSSNSSSSGELDEAVCHTTSNLHTTETIQSPDQLDDVSQNSNSNIQGCNDSCDSFKKLTEDKEYGTMKEDIYGDSDADSRDMNSTGNEADEENSIHSLKVNTYKEHSHHDFDSNYSSNGEGSQKLSFHVESAASQMNMESQCNSQSSVDQETHDMDSDFTEIRMNAQENMSENEQELSTDHFDNTFENDGGLDSNDKSDGIHLEDSNCSDNFKNSVIEDFAKKDDNELLEYDGSNEVKDANVNDAVCGNLTSTEDKIDENYASPREFNSPQSCSESANDKVPSFALESNTYIDTDEVGQSEKAFSCVGSPQSVAENMVEFTDNNNQCKEHEKTPGTQNVDDLGIEDISDVASDDLNQPDNTMDCDRFHTDPQQNLSDEVEKNVAQLFEHDSPPEHKPIAEDSMHKSSSSDIKRHSSSSRQSAQDDQEEGEIIDDLPFPKKENHQDYFTHEEDDFMDSTPRVNISDLPRIPKIKRDNTKANEPEELPLEAKRTSVLGRVDLGSSDISWKRLSQHTRERSYRDGRPKDESILFRDREPRQKDRKSKNEEKYRESERNKKDDGKKQESSRSRERSSKDRKSERTKGDHDKASRQIEKTYSTPEKREKEKYGKSYDRMRQDKYDREQSKSERDSSKKEKREKYKDKSCREDDKYDRDKCRAEEKYKRDTDRYELTSDRYDRSYEKVKEKEYKHKHKDHRESKDHKSDVSGSKKSKDEKRKRSHSSEHYAEKQKEREVRKVDDKLKIVVEHKEVKKDKVEKHFDKKHEKKHRDSSHHHHERKKKEPVASSYSDVTPTPIESKEIFAKGDSIIINVNFNRTSPREVFPPSGDEVFCREKKSSLVNSSKVESVNFSDESKHTLHDKENIFVDTVGIKRPSTPNERAEKNSTVSVGESYWHEAEDTDVNSPSADKSSVEKNCSDEDNVTPVENYGADDNLTDSDDNDNLPETQLILSKNGDDDEFSEIPTSERQPSEAVYLEEKETDCFNNSRRRSPQPPSPPSPADNDSYDPCEPTRSPSPPPSPPPVPPPLPTKNNVVDHPKPPPSPELPPLPPGPEPTDVIPREDPRSAKNNNTSQPSENISVSSPAASQQQVSHTQTTVESSTSMPNILLPPPTFPPRSTAASTTAAVQPQAVPPKTVSWQVPNPPAPLMFPPNHVHPVIRGNFLPSHIPTMGMPPQNVSATILPPTSSVPLMSQVRHLQLTTHGVMPNNQLIANVPLNIPQMQIPHISHPSTNAISAHHQMASMQSHPNSLSASNVVRVMQAQSQLPNIAVTIQNQHIANVLQNQNMSHFISQQNQVQTPTTTTHKSEKLKTSPPKEKSEVVDMDVDSPYSPGDSPSMDSNYDYSPPTSPLQKTPPGTQLAKDPFDTLLGPDRLPGNQDKMSSKSSGKVRLSSNCSDTPCKKAKLDSRTEITSKSRHSVRLQVTDKAKSRKEPKTSEKKELFSKLDDTQLKILDELPSSAVEMQVKEKFLKKLNRQERVVEEVKLVLKPYYKTREVNKEEYKDILRKSVPKICHNKSGEINPVKVKHLVESYVKKVKHARKKASKRHKASKYS